MVVDFTSSQKRSITINMGQREWKNFQDYCNNNNLHPSRVVKKLLEENKILEEQTIKI